MKNKIILAYVLALAFFVSIFGVKEVEATSANTIEIKLSNLTDEQKEELSGAKSTVFTYWDISKDYEYHKDFEKRDEISRKLYEMTDEELGKKYNSNKIETTFDKDSIKLKGIEEGFYYFRNIVEEKNTRYIFSFIVNIPLDSATNIILIDKVKTEPLENGRVKLIKTDQNTNLLENVGFELYNIQNERVPLIGTYIYNEKGDKNQILYTDKNGEINISNLPYGKYYFKEVKALDGYKLLKEKIEFEIVDNNLIELKVENIKDEKGGLKFLKIANDKNKTPLEGAEFKLTRKVDGKDEAVKIDGKEVYLKSDKEGKFEINGLNYGKYQLWEVKAPKGYKKISKAIDFTVNETSQEKVLIIKNDKEPKINVPKTGDLMIPLLLISSVALFGVGYKLAKSKEK